MAKKALVDQIIKLYSKLGGNVGEVLGTRSNINFLGVGKSPEGFIDDTINIDAIGILGKNKVLEELKSSIGYLTANKLNDVQAGKLYENMLKIDNVFNPKAPPANIIDLGTGTRNLDAEGLGSLRAKVDVPEGVDPNFIPMRADQYRDIFGKSPELSRVESQMEKIKGTSSKLDDAMKEYENIYKSADDIADDKVVEQMYRTSGPRSLDEDKMYLAEFIAEDAGKVLDDLPIAEQNKFIKRAENALMRNVKQYQDLPPPGSRGGPDDIAAPVQQYTNEIDALETMTKNRAGNEFITAYVDDIYKNAGVTSSVDVPKKRAAARAFLNSMLKKETDLLPPGKGGTLESVVSEADYKFITEGGGGALGDPLVLVKKYFGDEIARRLPLDTRTEVIDTFVDNVRFTKDRAGFRTDDPRFDPDDIPDFATGGRVGFMAGGIGRFTKAEVLIQRLLNTIKESKDKTDELSVYVNETFPGFIKEIKANPKLAENEQVWKTLGLDLPSDQRLVVHSDDTVDFFRQTEGPQNIAKVEAFMAKHPFLSREDALRIMKMEPEDRVLEITRLEILNRRTKNAHGGLAKILEV